MLFLLACLAGPVDAPVVATPLPAAQPAAIAPAAVPTPAAIDLSGVPHKLHQVAFLDGAWARPPDPGTLPGFELLDAPPTLIRRTGAGESRWPVVGAVADDGGWMLTAERDGVRIPVVVRPWASPSTPPPPSPAWTIQIGADASSDAVAWVSIP